MQMTRVLTAALVVAGSSLAESVDALKWPDIGVFGGYQGWSLWRSKFSSRPGGELATGGVRKEELRVARHSRGSGIVCPRMTQRARLIFRKRKADGSSGTGSA